jgi:probable F420-dependent oxidoreductase
MEYGIFDYTTHYTMQPAELGVAAEERGFDHLFAPEHSHIPISRKSPWPGGDNMPAHYWSMMDPFVVLGHVAAVTKTLRLGTGISLVIQRDPIQLAKEVATLDVLSNGRVMLGIGAGWNREEMEDHGTDWKTRFKRMRETMEACQSLWTDEHAEYHGDLISFDKCLAEPKPVQKPYPPIFLGGEGEKTIERIIRYGDGWMPLDPGVEHLTPGHMSFEEQVRELRKRGKDAGKGHIPIHIFMAPRKADRLKYYADLGIDGALFVMPPTGRDATLARLDEIAELRQKVA